MPDYRMKWIRIWPHAWFDSSMRIELTNEERAFWVDILALAGKCRRGGVIASGPADKPLMGYPLVMLSSLLVSWTPEQTSRILAKLESTDRVKIQKVALLSGEEGLVIEIVNWAKYQSEAQWVQKYRNTARSEKRNRTTGSGTAGRTEVEEEVDKEEEVEGEKKPNAPSALVLSKGWLPQQEWKDFCEMRQRIRAPLTGAGKSRIIAKLERLRAQGHDPAKVLGRSIENSWRGVFPIEERKHGGKLTGEELTRANLRAGGFIP